MGSRRFVSNEQSFSQNLLGSLPERSMDIAHDASFKVSRISQDERAYQSYAAFCRARGIPPLAFSDWSQKTDRINPTDVKVIDEFSAGMVSRRSGGDSYQTFGCGGGRRVLPKPQAYGDKA